MCLKVSVIIPTYQRPALIKKALEVLYLQDFRKEEFEVIVVTDGPDIDTSGMIEEEFRFRSGFNVTCKALPSKGGPAAARNAGWRSAVGNLILFTDDDCLPEPEWIQQFYDAYQFQAQSKISFTGKIIVPVSEKPTDFELNTTHLETADFVTANCACTKEALQLIDGFDDAFTMAWREDSDLEFRLLKAGIPVLKIKEAIVIHPVREAPWGVSLKEQKKSMFDALLFKKHPDLYREKIHSGILWMYFLMIATFIAFAVFLVLNQHKTALSFLACWVLLLSVFIFKRLANTTRTPKHIFEMIATSLLIPFLSVYWNLYGAFKFKTVHL